jgi:hypothetical protein
MSAMQAEAKPSPGMSTHARVPCKPKNLYRSLWSLILEFACEHRVLCFSFRFEYVSLFSLRVSQTQNHKNETWRYPSPDLQFGHEAEARVARPLPHFVSHPRLQSWRLGSCGKSTSRLLEPLLASAHSATLACVRGLGCTFLAHTHVVHLRVSVSAPRPRTPAAPETCDAQLLHASVKTDASTPVFTARVGLPTQSWALRSLGEDNMPEGALWARPAASPPRHVVASQCCGFSCLVPYNKNYY